MFFQFYHPNCEHAVHAGYNRPTYAGVLTGYNFEHSCNFYQNSYYPYDKYECYQWAPDGTEYWEMYIRRHGNGYNYVRLNCTFMKLNKTTEVWEWNQPFAGLASKMYHVTVPETLPTPLEVKFESNVVYGNDELIDLVQSAIDNASGPDSTVDTSTIILASQYLDCSKLYNLTTINGLSNVLIDDPRCIIDTTGSLTYDSLSGRRLQESSATQTPTELKYIDLSVKGIHFGANLFQDTLFRIRVESENSCYD